MTTAALHIATGFNGCYTQALIFSRQHTGAVPWTADRTSNWPTYLTFDISSLQKFITVRRYASAVYAFVVCLSVYHTPVLYQNG